jgi:hypothetical protein
MARNSVRNGKEAEMNLPYTYQLLTAADQQRHGFIKLRGAHADYEVRLMAEARLVEATFGDGKEGSFTSINRVTETGQAFLRAFKDQPDTSRSGSG